jgi:hypothetical protein
MAAESPTSNSTEAEQADGGSSSGTEPVVSADPALAAPDSLSSTAPGVTAEPVVLEPVAAEPVVVEPVATDTAAEPVVATPDPAAVVTAAPVVPAQQVVYVAAPRPFAAKGNRGFGILIAVLSTIIFAALYAAAGALADIINGQPADFSVITTADFWAPVALFAVGFILVVLVVNRAGWAAHVLGSLFVGLVVFFGGTGAILLLHVSQIPSNEVGATFTRVLFSSGAIVAGLLAREVSLWMGYVIAARGRRVKARNVDARVLYDQEIAAKRAEYERANAQPVAAVAVAPVTVPVVDEPLADSPATVVAPDAPTP